MAEEIFEKLNPGDFIAAAEYNRITEIITKLSTIAFGGRGSYGGEGIAFGPPESPWIYARLTDKTPSDADYPNIRYSWVEVIPDGLGGWLDLEGGGVGNADVLPAYEFNGIEVDVPVQVVLFKGNDNFMYFTLSDPSAGGQSGSGSGGDVDLDFIPMEVVTNVCPIYE